MLSGYESTAIVSFNFVDWDSTFPPSLICLSKSAMVVGTFMCYWSNTLSVPFWSFIVLSVSYKVIMGALLLWARWVETDVTVPSCF